MNMDLTSENITPNVIKINSQCSDRRFKYILERVVIIFTMWSEKRGSVLESG
jgi:hypothetical protein